MGHVGGVRTILFQVLERALLQEVLRERQVGRGEMLVGLVRGAVIRREGDDVRKRLIPAKIGLGDVCTWVRDEEAAGVPVAYPVGRSRPVLDGHLRTTDDAG